MKKKSIIIVSLLLGYVAWAADISKTTGLDSQKPWIEVLKNMDDNKTDTRTGAGAVSLNTLTTYLVTTGSAQALTLANGREGQIKTIVHKVDGGSAVLTPTAPSGFSTITFTNKDESATLEYTSGRGWCILGLYGATAATPTPTATSTPTATATPTP